MPRRRRQRKPDPFDLIGPIVAFIFILAIFAPFFIKALLQVLFIFLICAVVALVVFGFIWLVVRNMRARSGYQPPSPPLRKEPAKPFVYLNPYADVTWPKDDPPKVPSLEERLRAIDWYQFEKVVGAIYEVRGCSVKRLGGAKPDGGIDLLVEKDGERVVVQCKHWRKWSVGVRHVRELLGTLKDADIEKGVLVTLRGCTAEATELANKHDIHIVDEAELVGLMQMADGSLDQRIKTLLEDDRKYCPKCESRLVLRTAAKGFNQGQQFWGCSNYPRCRYILRNA